MSHSFLWQTALILIAVKLAGQASRAIGQPSVLGKLLVGVLLGPAVLGLLAPGEWVKMVAEVGVTLLMFLAGLETDLNAFKKSMAGAMLVAIIGVTVPFLGGWALATAWGYAGHAALFLGVLLVATSVSISVQTLRELGRLTSKAGTTILAAAVIDDVLGLIILSVTLGLTSATAGSGAQMAGTIITLLAKIGTFLAAGAVLGTFVVPPMLRAAAHFQVGAPRTAMAIAIALLFGYAAERLGVAAIVGAYLAGITMGAAGLGHALLHDIETVTTSFFAPFFFASVGLAANFTGATGHFWLFAGAVALVAIATKVVGCGAGAWLSGFKLQPSLSIGVGMIARGEVGLIVASIGLDKGIIDGAMYTTMIAVALITTLVTPPLLKWAFHARVGPAPAEGA